MIELEGFIRANGDGFYATATAARTSANRKPVPDSRSTPKARIAYQELRFWHRLFSTTSVN